ncbi:uncharacterized protein LOC124913029 [Impatiens glandulifera]|uniref:uncharacterized protein LOC124913029 n=1 Tax=Impatiens glandulifera TaxID=253017 RepID=UPI001FB0883B|nr:uncharacterized protein LOC124913029 [Impatiens glandulifera]
MSFPAKMQTRSSLLAFCQRSIAFQTLCYVSANGIYASEPNIVKYANIANHLPDKTIRDVAFRIKWMNETVINNNKKEIMKSDKRGTKRRVDDNPSISVGSINSDEADSFKASLGVVGELVEENYKAYDQINSNFGSLETYTNFNLLSQARNNIFKIISYMDEDVELMKYLPPIPEKINIEVANLFLGPF